MQLEVGKIVEGKVTGITKFGAFVELSEGKTGMVHISEVAMTYVNDINDFIQEGQMVKVKILSVSPEGKVSLSIKKAMPAPPQQPRRDAPRGGAGGGSVWTPPRKSEGMTFEDMMSKFKQTSDDKMSDLKRYTDTKRGTGNGRSRGGR